MNLRKKLGMLLLAIAALLTVSACSSKPTEVIVSAAASLTDALKEIEAVYEKQQHKVDLQFNFGASGALQQQIEQGAQVDLFVSAAEKNMKALVEKGMITESDRTNLLGNEMVVIVPQDSTAAIVSESDLQLPELKKIAIGIPESVPAGNYAKEALTAGQLWEPLQNKLVQAKDVRQVLNYVETGNADAGIVYKTDALSSSKVKIALAVNPAHYSPIVYPIGIVSETKHKQETEAFYEYLQSPEALDIFKKYGFSALQ
jgi:molybdate transport system substrate-binding protein